MIVLYDNILQMQSVRQIIMFLVTPSIFLDLFEYNI